MDASASSPASAVAQQAAMNQLDEEQITKAVEALLANSKKRKNTKVKGSLLNDNDTVFLMVVLWKIPSVSLKARLPLPHGIRTDLAEVCLFTKDERDSTAEKTENFYKNLLSKHGIKTVSQIIPMQTLKTEYKAYEAKRRLLASFDFFLADARIQRLLPTHLGRHFYSRKKFPVGINLLSKNLSREISQSVGGTVLNITKSGSCSTIRVGHTGMASRCVVENVLAVADALAQRLPEKWESVKLLYLKTEKSASLPIFSSFVSIQDDAELQALRQKKNELKQKKKAKIIKRREKKRRKQLKVATKVASSPVQKEEAPKTSAALLTTPGPQKAETSAKKKKPSKAKPQPQGGQDVSEDEIPTLVPIGATPGAASVQVQKPPAGKPTPIAAKTPVGKKRKAPPTSGTPIGPKPTTPGQGSEKKLRMKEPEKEKNPSVGKKDPRQQTPKKPEAKFFTTAKASPKAPQTPKRRPNKLKVPPSS
ncbi:ribosomal L1 domain-containing protein 1 [Suncus etruscus]|uniref:ribosomal L1 domain-containing protein 1 n=1 Tax=Suncus etruscus TaxID=109475 RepID=UPI00210F86F9|nr:ribosomal L1 domain-containing protein 1 [Suncus etruscus]